MKDAYPVSYLTNTTPASRGPSKTYCPQTVIYSRKKSDAPFLPDRKNGGAVAEACAPDSTFLLERQDPPLLFHFEEEHRISTYK